MAKPLKSANWRAAGLAAAVSLLVSNACCAADILFSEAASTCLRNHADVEKVLSAADATGWHGWPLLSGARSLGLKGDGR
jgi:hypothetical protein